MEDVKSAMYNEAQSRLSKSYSQKAIMDAINDIKELEKYMPKSDPIADLFPRATVMSAGKLNQCLHWQRLWKWIRIQRV